MRNKPVLFIVLSWIGIVGCQGKTPLCLEKNFTLSGVLFEGETLEVTVNNFNYARTFTKDAWINVDTCITDSNKLNIRVKLHNRQKILLDTLLKDYPSQGIRQLSIPYTKERSIFDSIKQDSVIEFRRIPEDSIKRLIILY
jgi:hypothetical protein